jgi:5-methylcytosine-specific restriction enzyme A
MATNEPVFTLTRGVANTITGVDDDRIRRHSAEPRSEAGQDADVPKSQVLAIWDQLDRTGSSTGTSSSVLYFAYALVALVPGVGAQGPRDLYFSDRDLAMQPFRDATEARLPLEWHPIDEPGRFVHYSRRLEQTGRVVTGYSTRDARTDDELRLVDRWAQQGLVGAYVVWDYESGEAAAFETWAPAYAYSLTLDGTSWDDLAPSVQQSIRSWDRDFESALVPFEPATDSVGFAPTTRTARNPSWTHDELILALDLYLRDGLLDDTDSRLIDLSDTLSALPIHSDQTYASTFRNPNGVALKLANFAALDPAYPGAGMRRGSQLDGEVWDRFNNDRASLHQLAELLRNGAANPGEFPSTVEEDEDEADEGRLLFRRHRRRERDQKLVAKKKAAVRKAKRTLVCEVCGFDFEKTYGSLGHDYIECHHIVPLSESGATKTRLPDLALLCSNCHRMAHRRRPWPTMDDLRALLEP